LNKEEIWNEKLENTCGKKVKISYVPFDHLLISNKRNIKPEKFNFTEGIIDNFCPPNIYIINKNGCIEMFKVEQVYQMTEINEFEIE
jgi:hypothetical protein